MKLGDEPMFMLDKESNKITEIKSKTFHDFGFKERVEIKGYGQSVYVAENIIIIMNIT